MRYVKPIKDETPNNCKLFEVSGISQKAADLIHIRIR
jgi:hypothetical protein